MEKKKTSNNFITICVNAFNKFVATFKKYGVATVTYILLLFLIFYSFVINPININNIVEKALDNRHNQTQQLKEESANRRMAADEILIPIMENIAERPDVSRVLLFEKHNSTQNLSGIDFLYLSSTYETIDPNQLDLDYIGDSFQKQYVTNMLGTEIMGLLRHKDYLYYNHIENCNHPNHRLLHKLRKLDAKSVMLIPFRNSKNQPLLILAVISNPGEFDAKSIYEYVKPYENSIKQALM